MLFADLMTLDKAPVKTSDGYLVAMPRVARTGIQEYLGSELGRPDLSVVRVYRPEAEVFSRDSLHSFAHRPVTVDHPPVMVDASNWKKYGVGTIGDEVVRDGEFVRVPLVLMDQAAIDDVMSGKGELSMGYTADIIFDSGVSPRGEKYDAYQSNIRGNHLAIVDKARGGSQLRVLDSGNNTLSIKPLDIETIFSAEALTALADAIKNHKPTEGNPVTTKTILVDGISITIPVSDAQYVEKALSDAATKLTTANAALATAQTSVATLTTQVQTKDAEIATLKKQLEDAKNPAAIDAAVKARAVVVDSAKKILPAVVVDGKTDAEIKRQVVDSKLGDLAKGWNDDQVSASFAALSVSAPAASSDPFASAVRDGSNVNVSDAEKARIERDKELSAAWKQK